MRFQSTSDLTTLPTDSAAAEASAALSLDGVAARVVPQAARSDNANIASGAARGRVTGVFLFFRASAPILSPAGARRVRRRAPALLPYHEEQPIHGKSDAYEERDEA